MAAGYAVQAWNRSALSPDLTEGISLCRDLSEAARANVCILMLLDSAAVDGILDKLSPHLTAGQLVMDMGSSDPANSRVNARRLMDNGIGWLDAPVSGGPEGAAQGSLAIMVGGTKNNYQRAKPILDVLADNVVHVGGAGQGHAVKVINQLIVGLTIETVAEALTLAEVSGVTPRMVQLALKGGFADSKILQLHGTRMIERSYKPGARAAIQLKDLIMAKGLADEAAIHLPHLNSTIERYQILEARGDAGLDHSALHKLLWSRSEATRHKQELKEKKMTPYIIPDEEALGTCAWCQGKIQEFEDVIDLGAKLKADIDLSEYESHCIELDLASVNKSIYMLVTASDSEAKKKGDDGMFLLCSEDCGKNLKDVLDQEVTAGPLFERIRFDPDL
jgi:3-hydroxyisobutyrate dehydrogenase-like beta-hydroxyacid dehydrogenase